MNDLNFFIIFIVNITILAIPTFFTGSITGPAQGELLIKLKALSKLHEQLSQNKPDLELKPMLGLIEGKQDDKQGKLPEDAKLMIALKNQPSEFYGVQINCSLNDVGGAKYPYVYAVVLASEEFAYDISSGQRPKGKNIVFEPSSKDGTLILVLREKTTKTSGYHTNEKRQLEITTAAIEFAETLVGEL
jgi:hypothetical protein